MEVKKCSSKKHEENNAIFYCPECKIYMCNKCEKHHIELFKNHHIFELKKDNNDIFTGLCKEKTHSNKLEYYCYDHNQLCCVECLCMVKRKRKGQHKNCKVCLVKNIKNIKKNKLSVNIKYLEELSNTLQQSIDQIKKIFEENNKNKEKLKTEVQKLFTKLRNIINEREDQIFLEIDKQFDETFFKEELIKESEKLPKKVNTLLQSSKIEDNVWNDKNKLSFLINNCINIENSIKDINLIIYLQD